MCDDERRFQVVRFEVPNMDEIRAIVEAAASSRDGDA